MSKNAKRYKKEAQERERREIKDKFIEERVNRVPPLSPKNERQRAALSMLDKKQMMVLAGASGSGKTEISCWYASKLWIAGDIDNIIITRPNKSMNGDDAAIPGNDFQKTLPYTMAMLMKFKKYLGAGTLKNNLRQDMEEVLFHNVSGIQVYSMEKLNGLSFDHKTLIICDESQSSTVGQMKSLLTRCERGCRLFVCGDLLQSAIGENNGLRYLLDTLKVHPNNDIGVVEFEPEDCCREGISAFFTKIFEEEGEWTKNNN